MDIAEPRVATERANRAVWHWMLFRARPLNPIVRCNTMDSMNLPNERVVTIHGEEWKIDAITADVRWCLTQKWHRELWKASPALIDKLGGKSTQFNSQSFDAKKVDLVDDGWAHDHCAICWWTLHETENEEEGVGYRNENNGWVCSECYCQFIRDDSLNMRAAANNPMDRSGGSAAP